MVERSVQESRRESRAVQLLAEVFREAGWRVLHNPSKPEPYPDLVVRRRGASYGVELKMGAEGRSDRLIPLWSQAFLQASRSAGKHVPLAVVAAPRIAPRVARHILDFAEEYAPRAAAGVIDLEGLRAFRGPGLENLDALPSRPLLRPGAAGEQAHLFSDLNQWMLKVLLAPEIPAELISAPRQGYRNASQLAQAAGVSVMSAFRFVQQLQRQGYLHESGAPLRLVRRAQLFARWQASNLRSANEVPMRFLFSGQARSGVREILSGGRACLALFAAADALGFGIVEGVPPHLYVRRLSSDPLAWKNMVPAEHGERPDLIVRQAPAPQSVFRGIVHPQGLASCDILQVWLDVSGHPSRGQEQADAIRQRVLARVVEGDSRG
jgi:hypothetical protein